MLLFKNNFGTYKTMARLRAFKGYHFGIIKFNLPDLGEKIKEGTIKKLYVKEGDSVKEFQKIADVASDKQFT
jgi:2-oxoisovalerate dehydrogenase E2 component (dihydrolipoyl transacylase)